MRLRALLLGVAVAVVAVAVARPVAGAEPPVKPKAAQVPAANGTKACNEARQDLAALNRDVQAFNKLAKGAKSKQELARVEALGRQLQRRIAAAVKKASTACKKQEDKPQQPAGGNQGGNPTADRIEPPADNGSAACRDVIKRINYGNSELAKAVKNYKFRAAARPLSDVAKRAQQAALDQINTRIARLKRDRQKEVEKGKTACFDFAGTWTGGWSGTFVSDSGCTIGERGEVTIQIARSGDGYSVSETFHGLLQSYADDCSITRTGDETFTSGATVQDGKLVGENFTIPAGGTLMGEYSRTYTTGTETVRYSARRG